MYRVGSVAKLITAYALLLQDGINLGDSITDFVPDLRELEAYHDITLRMLMSHLGGGAHNSQTASCYPIGGHY